MVRIAVARAKLCKRYPSHARAIYITPIRKMLAWYYAEQRKADRLAV